MSKVVTVHGHTLELDMGPSCPNPGIRRQLDAKKDCVIPATTFDKGPLQFEIDEQLNTTWYKE